MALIWLLDLQNEKVYHPIIDEDDYGFRIPVTHLNTDPNADIVCVKQYLQKNEHHLSRVIGVVNDD